MPTTPATSEYGAAIIGGLDEMAFWAGTRSSATYQLSTDAYGLQFTLKTTNVYFGGKLILKGTYSTAYPVPADYATLAAVVADRLGSIGKFYPYGRRSPRRQRTTPRNSPATSATRPPASITPINATISRAWVGL